MQVQYGRIPKDIRGDYDGQWRTKTLPTLDKARASYDKIIHQKLKEG